MSDLGSEITDKDDRLSMGRVYGLETWKTDDKWNGKPSARKSYIQRIEGILKRFPEMMATWNSRLAEGYTYENFASLSHEYAVERTRQRLRDASDSFSQRARRETREPY